MKINQSNLPEQILPTKSLFSLTITQPTYSEKHSIEMKITINYEQYTHINSI